MRHWWRRANPRPRTGSACAPIADEHPTNPDIAITPGGPGLLGDPDNTGDPDHLGDLDSPASATNDEPGPDSSETRVEDRHDGEVQDGEVQDGEVQDGEVQDGEVQDGEVQDGEVQDGEVQDGEGGRRSSTARTERSPLDQPTLDWDDVAAADPRADPGADSGAETVVDIARPRRRTRGRHRATRRSPGLRSTSGITGIPTISPGTTIAPAAGAAEDTCGGETPRSGGTPDEGAGAEPDDDPEPAALEADTPHAESPHGDSPHGGTPHADCAARGEDVDEVRRHGPAQVEGPDAPPTSQRGEGPSEVTGSHHTEVWQTPADHDVTSSSAPTSRFGGSGVGRSRFGVVEPGASVDPWPTDPYIAAGGFRPPPIHADAELAEATWPHHTGRRAARRARNAQQAPSSGWARGAAPCRGPRPWWVTTAAMLVTAASLGVWAFGQHPATAVLPAADTSPYGATGMAPAAFDAARFDPAAFPPAAGMLGVPRAALEAYQRAEDRLGVDAPGCRLPWALLAGIGKVESDHAGAGAVTASGQTLAPIRGPVLNGAAGNAAMADTDRGGLDADPVWERAVGPMQFLPRTWMTYGDDNNGDALADPHNLPDAALGAGRYLCAGGTDLADPTQLHDAVFRYNRSENYVASVLSWARAYTDRASAQPDATTPPAALATPRSATPRAPAPTAPPVPARPAVPPAELAAAPSTPAAPTGPTLIEVPGPVASAAPTAATATPVLRPEPTPTTTTPITAPTPDEDELDEAGLDKAGEASTKDGLEDSGDGSSTSSGSSGSGSAGSLGAGGTGVPGAQGAASCVPTSGSTEGNGQTGGSGSSSGLGAAGGLLLDTTRGDLAQWFTNSGNRGLLEDAQRPRVVANPLDPGREAFAFTVPGGGTRSEVLPRGAQNFRSGDRAFFGYTGHLAPGFPVDTEDWQLIFQFHHEGNTGSPPLALEVKAGQLWLTAGGSGKADQPLGPVRAGQTINVALEVAFATGGGSVSAWREGQPVLEGWQPPQGTMLDARNYLKVGLYRSEDITTPGTVYLHSLKIGDSLAAVDGCQP